MVAHRHSQEFAQAGARPHAPGIVAQALRLFLPALAAASCFDVRQVDPGSDVFVIADFEKGDALPNTKLFTRWFCLTFNPQLGQDPAQTVTCGLEQHPGDQSQFGLMATFNLHNATATFQYAGMNLMTMAEEAAVDFSGFADLVFRMKVDLSDPPPPMVAVDVQLGCNSVSTQDENSTQEYFDLYHKVDATPSWRQFSVPLSSFVQRQDETSLIKGGPKACLVLVDSVRFEVVGTLMGGQSGGGGTIHIDDVHLENPITIK